MAEEGEAENRRATLRLDGWELTSASQIGFWASSDEQKSRKE